MALGNLTSYDLSSRLISLDYSDGRQWYVPYKALVATLIDPTSGSYVGYLYPKAMVGETLSATQSALATLGTTVPAFISSINEGIGVVIFYDEYQARATADGAFPEDPIAAKCGLDAMLNILI